MTSTIMAAKSPAARPLTFTDDLCVGQELVPVSVLDIVEAGQEKVVEATQEKDAAMLKLIQAQQDMIARLIKENTTVKMELTVAKSQTAESEVAHQAEVMALKELVETTKEELKQKVTLIQNETAILKEQREIRVRAFMTGATAECEQLIKYAQDRIPKVKINFYEEDWDLLTAAHLTREQEKHESGMKKIMECGKKLQDQVCKLESVMGE